MNKQENQLTPVSTTAAIHLRDGDVARKVEEKKHILYDLVDLTEIFKVSKRTIFNWKAKGILPLFELGGKLFISRESLLAFIAGKERRVA